MATYWLLLLLFGCTLATPFSRRTPEEEAHHQRRREVTDETDPNIVDHILRVNEETDEESALFEGDIKDAQKVFEALKGNGKRSTTFRSFSYIWVPRIVPYIIDSSLAEATRNNILEAIANFHFQTCIKWVPRTTETYYVVFKKLTGCWSLIGKAEKLVSKSYQEISIGEGCESVGTILHEMMHCLGVWHEQARPDRGTKIEIMWEHIKDGKESDFEAHGEETLNAQGTPYDPESIMQYGNYAFSKDGKMTIRLLINPAQILGQRKNFSSNDVIALNNLYSCSVKDGGWSVWSTYSPCDANCMKSRSRFCTNEVKTACNPALTEGIETASTVCPHEECYAPVAGHWNKWSSWGGCTKTCDEGTRTRTRVCDNPAPKHGGAACVGSSSNTGICKIKSCSSGPGDCEFEENAKPFCDWSQDSSDTNTVEPNWMRGVNTPSKYTGPTTDHTTGSGHFAFGEASKCVLDTTTRLQSVEFPASSSAGRCMSLWYYAYGARLGGFNVYVRSGGAMTKLYGFTGDQGQTWKEAKIHIPHQSATYQMVLEMVCGGSYKGDVAVDDILFKDGAC